MASKSLSSVMPAKKLLPEADSVCHSETSMMPEVVSDVGEPEENVQSVGDAMKSRLSASASFISS